MNVGRIKFVNLMVDEMFFGEFIKVWEFVCVFVFELLWVEDGKVKIKI